MCSALCCLQLLPACCVPVTCFSGKTPLEPLISLSDKLSYHPHFTDETKEACRGCVTCPRQCHW